MIKELKSSSMSVQVYNDSINDTFTIQFAMAQCIMHTRKIAILLYYTKDDQKFMDINYERQHLDDDRHSILENEGNNKQLGRHTKIKDLYF